MAPLLDKLDMLVRKVRYVNTSKLRKRFASDAWCAAGCATFFEGGMKKARSLFFFEERIKKAKNEGRNVDS